MKILLEIIFMILEPDGFLYLLESIAAFFLDPIIDNNKWVEDLLYRQAFKKADARYRKDRKKKQQDEPGEDSYKQWLHSLGYEDEEQLYREQLAIFQKETGA